MNHRAKHYTELPILSRAQSTVATTPEAKPRKANSEARKQQNRIASRNYREKRKRKLQQLQQLLENDEPKETQVHMRSMSPYDDRSCSGSISYQHSAASASPHIAAVNSRSGSTQPDHPSIASQVWDPPVTSSTQTCMYSDTYSSPPRPATAYMQSGLTTTTCPAWILSDNTASTIYPMMNTPHSYTYPAHIPPYPPTDFDIMHTAGPATDPYERRYHPHGPQ